MFARGSGHEHWEDVKKNQKLHIQKWHKMGEVDTGKADKEDKNDGKSRLRKGRVKD